MRRREALPHRPLDRREGGAQQPHRLRRRPHRQHEEGAAQQQPRAHRAVAALVRRSLCVGKRRTRLPPVPTQQSDKPELLKRSSASRRIPRPSAAAPRSSAALPPRLPVEHGTLGPVVGSPQLHLPQRGAPSSASAADGPATADGSAAVSAGGGGAPNVARARRRRTGGEAFGGAAARAGGGGGAWRRRHTPTAASLRAAHFLHQQHAAPLEAPSPPRSARAASRRLRGSRAPICRAPTAPACGSCAGPPPSARRGTRHS